MYPKRKKNSPIYDSGKMGSRVKRSNPVILFRSAMNTAGTGYPRGQGCMFCRGRKREEKLEKKQQPSLEVTACHYQNYQHKKKKREEKMLYSDGNSMPSSNI